MATNVAAATPTAHLKRALGVWDLTWLCVVAIANLNIVPVIAASGPSTIWLWLLALVFFFLPQGITVIELAHRFPAEGGLYLWTKEVYGDFHGFLCGWCYWITNMFFLPTLLFYLGTVITYVGGKQFAHLAEDRVFFFLITVSLLWVAAIANIYGVGVGKWVSNAGGIGTVIAAIVLISLAVYTVMHTGATIPASGFAIQKIDWPVISAFGIICFGLVGLELGPIMGDEIRDPRRNVPRGTLWGGTLSGVLYIGATLALLLAVPQKDIGVLSGILQAVDKMSAGNTLGWVLAPLAILIAIAIAGSTSAWVSGSARILFVSGIDRYLPKVFGRVHPKYGTPHIALIAIAVVSSLLVSMSFIGSSVKEAYVTLLDLSVVLQMLSYLYLYASLTRIAFGPTAGTGFYGKTRVQLAAISGLATTFLGLIVAFVPSRQVNSVWLFELKMVLTSILFLGLGAGLFAYYSRRKI